MVGKIGEVREPIAPGTPGKLFVHGETWRAVSSETLPRGTRATARSFSIGGTPISISLTAAHTC